MDALGNGNAGALKWTILASQTGADFNASGPEGATLELNEKLGKRMDRSYWHSRAQCETNSKERQNTDVASDVEDSEEGGSVAAICCRAGGVLGVARRASCCRIGTEADCAVAWRCKRSSGDAWGERGR